MKVLVHYSPPSAGPTKLVENRLGPCGSKHLIEGKNQDLLNVHSTVQLQSVYFNQQKARKSLNFLQLQDYRVSTARVSNKSYDSYVIDTEESLETLSGDSKSIPKVLIPGLPDESNGEKSAAISSCFWEWKPKFNVHYDKSGCENVGSPPVLFLPGFGVGSFHYEKQLKDLGRDYRVWALDFLGQGMSLPAEDPAPLSNEDGYSKNSAWGFGDDAEPWAKDLSYSADLWKDQVQYFVEEVIGEPVYIVGNSLGGFVALYFAACNPKLVKGVTLLNATPFWGLLPNPIKSPFLASLFPWSGTFPLPAKVKKLIQLLWLKISDPDSIADVLKQVYADHTTNVDKVFSRILETTEHPAASAALTSIMFAPKAQLSFKESLSRCRENSLPICLMYGKEDPWVTPIWGRQVKRQLPDAPYYEISPAGHCPHDEVPEVVNYLLRGWIKNLETESSMELPLLDDGAEMTCPELVKDIEFIRNGSKKSVRVRFFGSTFSLWSEFVSRVRDHLQSLVTQLTQA